MALASCSGVPLGGSGQIVHFWNLFGGGDGARLADMQSNFVDSNPNLELESTTLTWGAPYYTKLSMSTVGGRPPEVAVMHQTRLGAYAPAGLLEPLDPAMLAEYDIGPDKFLPEVLESAKYQGEIFTIPLDTHPQVMFYNTDIAKKAGLLEKNGDLKPIEGADAVIDAFKKAKEVTGEQGVAFAPVDGAVPWRLFYTLYGQLGGEVLSPDASEVVLDQEKAEQAVEYLVELTVGEELTPATQDYAAAVAQFQSGNAGFHWNGEWEVTTFADAGMPFSIVPFPSIFGNNTVQADRHTFVIPKGVAKDSQENGRSPHVHKLHDEEQLHLGGGRAHSGVSTHTREPGVQGPDAAVQLRRGGRRRGARPQRVVLGLRFGHGDPGRDTAAAGDGRRDRAERGGRPDARLDAGAGRHALTAVGESQKGRYGVWRRERRPRRRSARRTLAGDGRISRATSSCCLSCWPTRPS